MNTKHEIIGNRILQTTKNVKNTAVFVCHIPCTYRSRQYYEYKVLQNAEVVLYFISNEICQKLVDHNGVYDCT